MTVGCNSTLDNLPNDTWKKLFGTHCCFVTMTASLENLGVLFLFYRFSRLQTPSHKIMTSLVVADFLTGSILAPLYAVQFLNERLLRNCVVESIRRYATTLLVGASTFTLGFISYDRCLHLTKLKQYSMKNKILYTGLSLCWLIPLLLPLLRLTSNTEDAYSLTVITFGILILTTIIVSYFAVVLSLRKYSKRCAIKTRSLEKERKAAVTVVIIITLYIFMMVPVYIHMGLSVASCFDRYFLARSYCISIVLSVTNSCINPIVYCYRTAEMRKHIRRTFRTLRPNISNKISSDDNFEYPTEGGRTFTRVSQTSC